MTPEDEIRRGGDAARLLRDAMYVESWSMVRERLVSLLEQDLPDDKRKRIGDLIFLLSKAKGYVEQVAAGGRMAAQQIERDRTFRERVQDRIRGAA